MALVLLLALGSAVAALAVLTGLGGRQRGLGSGRATIAGLFFPLTWAVWYVKDERPFR